MTAWCECEHPETDQRDFGMCQRCKRKPHSECRACREDES